MVALLRGHKWLARACEIDSHVSEPPKKPGLFVLSALKGIGRVRGVSGEE
jgi:hypothetical protein